MTISVAIHGAAGRMGRRLVAFADADPMTRLVAALERPDHSQIGHDSGRLAGTGDNGIPISSKITSPADVIIDFSLPEPCLEMARWCCEHDTPLVVATTGLTDSQQHELGEIAQRIPVVWAPSMSLAVNLAMQLVGEAAKVLSRVEGDVDVEIIERHHRFKEDAPSGTALRLGEIVSNNMGQTAHQHGRSGRVGSRPHHEIGYHALRVGDNPGEHTVVFGLLGETIELTVKATNRDAYAIGAFTAARYIVSQTAGLYTMADVLGIGAR